MKKLKSWKSINIILICLCINIIGRQNKAQSFYLPFWLDAIGTIAVAIELGPIVGAICGMATNIIVSSGDFVAFPYLLVSAAIAITAGFLYSKNNVNSQLKIFYAAVVTGLVAAPIISNTYKPQNVWW